MKNTVIGVNGQLGWQLNRRAKKQGVDVVAADAILLIAARIAAGREIK